MSNLVVLTDFGVGFKQKDGKVKQVLKNISIEIKKGEKYALIAKSGAGKTTLLLAIAGLIYDREKNLPHLIEKKSVVISGENIKSTGLKISLIFQNYGLLPHLSVMDNLRLPFKLSGEIFNQLRADNLLTELGIYEKRNSNIHTLSGGEAQRVSIARALLISPDLLLMDEPFSSLDEFTREKLVLMTKNLLSSRNEMSMVLVTHSIREAMKLSSKIIFLNEDGQGITLLESPSEEEVAGRIGFE